jgi:hypothetical protein
MATAKIASDLRLGVTGEAKALPWQLHKGIGEGHADLLVVPMNGTPCTLHGLLAALTDQEGIKCLILPTDFDLEVALPKETEKSLQGIWSIVGGEIPRQLSFAKTANPTENGYTAVLAECALAWLRGNKGMGHSISRIPTKFVGVHGKTRWFGEFYATLKHSLSTKDKGYIADTLHSLITLWCEHNADLGRRVLFSQRIPWKEVERRALPYSKIKKRTRKGPVMILERESYFKSTRNPLMDGFERHCYAFLDKVLFEEKKQLLEQNWTHMDPSDQHTRFNDVVKRLQQLDQEGQSFHSHVNAWIGHRVRLIETVTNFTCNKKDKKKRGRYMILLANAYTSVEKKKLSLKAALVFHPLGGVLGTIAETLAKDLFFGAYKGTEAQATHPGLGNWARAEQRWIDTYGVTVRPSLAEVAETTPIENPWAVLDETPSESKKD